MPLFGRSSRHGCCSTAGRRAINEDRAATLALSDGRYLAVVADGMGGARGGNVASEAALKAFVRAVRTNGDGGEEARLCAAFVAADAAIHDALTPDLTGMGSTLVAAVTRERDIWVANIGDSRAVLVANDGVMPLSTEHSVVGKALRDGHITEVEALRHPERHVISRAIGEGDARPDVSVHTVSGSSGKAVVVVGSDGLFNFIGDSEILELTEDAPSAAAVAERLVRRAVENGSDDNVSAAALFVGEKRRRSQTIAITAAIVLVTIAAAAAYPYRRTIAAQMRRVDPRRDTLRGERVEPTRVRIPAAGHRQLRMGMSGSLCTPPNDCFAAWRVVAADASSVTLEFRPLETSKRPPSPAKQRTPK